MPPGIEFAESRTLEHVVVEPAGELVCVVDAALIGAEDICRRQPGRQGFLCIPQQKALAKIGQCSPPFESEICGRDGAAGDARKEVDPVNQ